MSLVLNSLLRLSTFVQGRKQLWIMRTFQIPVVPYLHDMEPQGLPARHLCMTVVCQAGKHRNTIKKLVSIVGCLWYERYASTSVLGHFGPRSFRS